MARYSDYNAHTVWEARSAVVEALAELGENNSVTDANQAAGPRNSDVSHGLLRALRHSTLSRGDNP